MDPSKLKNKRWTALVPQRQSLHLRKSHHPSSTTFSKNIHLIGKLPEEAYIAIFTYVGISDIVNLALTCREVHKLSRDERVWRAKLKALNWKGEDPPEAKKVLERQRRSSVNDGEKRDAIPSGRKSLERDALSTIAKKSIQPTASTTSTTAGTAGTAASNTYKRTSLTSTAPLQTSQIASNSTPKPSIPAPFGGIESIGDDDDGFGDFVDFSSPSTSVAPVPGSNNNAFNASGSTNGLNGLFAHIDLNAQPLQPTRVSSNTAHEIKTVKKRQDEDLLMLFDDGAEDDDIGLGSATPLPLKHVSKSSLSTTGNTSTNTPQANGHSSSLSASSSSFTDKVPRTQASSSSSSSSSCFSRDLFIAYFKYLLPYYTSLQYQSTTSLLFTQSHPSLDDTSKAYILTNLTSLLDDPTLAPTQYEQTRLSKTRRNLRSSVDWFDARLLNRFEKSRDSRIVSEMREAAFAYCALHDTSTNTDVSRDDVSRHNDGGSGSAGKGGKVNGSRVNGNGTGGNANGQGSAAAAAGDSSIIQIFINKIPLFYDNSWDPLANLTKTFDTSGQLVDGIDFSAMDEFMNHVIGTVQKEGTTIARVFPPDSDALVYFTDRIANDVISDYIIPLLNAAHNLTNHLFLLTTAATFGQLQRLITTVCSIEPKSSSVTLSSVSKVVYDMFRPYTSDYLKEEPVWCREYLNEICIEWERKLAEERANRDPTFLNAQNPQQAKRNILAGFTKALLLPVTIVPKTVALSVNAITTGGTMAFNAMTGTFTTSSSASVANGGTSTPKGTVAASATTRTSGSSTPPITPSTSEKKEFPALHGESFQSLISIETAMQLIQADRECLKRVQTFAGYTGDVGLRVKRVIEEIFVILCQTVSANHLTPAFAKATEQMGQYKPADHAVDQSVAPLVQFFELVHIGDTILQMVQVYYDREMLKYIDKNDFLSQVVREKKKFENALDESVASGLNAGVNILMTQAEYILQTQQEPSDFCPELKNANKMNGAVGVVDIEGPTKAAEAVVDCLRSHCQMLKGSTDKAILEVFHQEVGLRLHGMLLKHLKKSIVSISGGFQVIADLNLYTSFVNSLKLPNVNPYFTALKMAANVFIIDSPRDLGMMARDLERYEGTLRIEDIMEMVQCRTDWKKIEREVEKEVFGFKTEDCVVA